MGTWGADIFSDDLAADVRSQWRTLVGDGVAGPDATQALLREYEDVLADPDTQAVFWLALALTQYRAGRLEVSVRNEALRQISDPRHLEQWKDDPERHRRRIAILEKARLELLSLPPAPKRIRKRYRDVCEWVVGDVVAYQLPSGLWTLFRVVWLHADFGGTSPVVEFLDWSSESLPASAPVGLRVRLDVRDKALPENRVTRVMIGATSARHKPQKRLHTISRGESDAGSPVFSPFLVTLWPDLDEALARYFGLL